MQAWADHGIGKPVCHKNGNVDWKLTAVNIVVGRGVFIDYWSYAKKAYDPFTTHPISLSELLACAKAQNVEFQYGDILMIRSGWIDTYNNMDDKDRKALELVKNYAHEFVGVEQSEEMVDFLHDNYFSAVAGDTPAFESWPTDKDWNHHGILLPLWGMPIGEMWDLEKLSEVCKEPGQYSFFFSSIPTNVMGECDSPAPVHFWSKSV